jgi:hypothetical protein
MSLLHTDQSEAPSERELLARKFAEWVSERRWSSGQRVFDAPYGVIQGLANGKRERGVTFGVARRADIHLSIYSPKYMILRDSRHGNQRCSDLEAVQELLREWYGFPPM